MALNGWLAGPLAGWRERAGERLGPAAARLETNNGNRKTREGRGQIDEASPAQGRGAGREDAKTASSAAEGAIRKAGRLRVTRSALRECPWPGRQRACWEAS